MWLLIRFENERETVLKGKSHVFLCNHWYSSCTYFNLLWNRWSSEDACMQCLHPCQAQKGPPGGATRVSTLSLRSAYPVGGSCHLRSMEREARSLAGPPPPLVTSLSLPLPLSPPFSLVANFYLLNILDSLKSGRAGEGVLTCRCLAMSLEVWEANMAPKILWCEQSTLRTGAGHLLGGWGHFLQDTSQFLSKWSSYTYTYMFLYLQLASYFTQRKPHWFYK